MENTKSKVESMNTILHETETERGQFIFRKHEPTSHHLSHAVCLLAVYAHPQRFYWEALLSPNESCLPRL